MESPRETALYVYGIGEREALLPLLVQPPLPEPVEPGATLEVAGAGALAALFSAVPAEEYGEESLTAHLADGEWTAIRAMRHQRVVEHFARRAAVVPLRFGTLFLRRERIEALLADRAAELQALVDRLRDRDEWSVSVYCDRDRLLAGLEAVSEPLREAAARAAGASPGQAFLLRKKLDALRVEEARRTIAQVASEIEVELASTSDGSTRLRVLKETLDEEGVPIARLAFLVARARFEMFREAAEALAARHAALGFKLALTGPLPAYSFAGGSSLDAT